VAAVSVVTEQGEPLVDPQVEALLLTPVGAMLEPARVRETVFHLMNLRRFENIVVVTTPAGDEAVSVTFVVVPRRAFDGIVVRGRLGVSERQLRNAVPERFTDAPTRARMDSAAERMRLALVDRGFRSATVSASLVEGDRAGTVRLAFDVDAGERSRIGDVVLEGTAHRPLPLLRERLGLTQGASFDRTAIDRRVSDELDELRRRGHFQARIDVDPLEARGDLIDLRLLVDAGPVVTVRFEGDEVPRDVRSRFALDGEAGFDEDLLEDAQRGLERYFRDQGYRQARVQYRRNPEGDRVTVTFDVVRGPLHRVDEVVIAGARALPESDLAALVPLVPGEAFVETVLDGAERAVRDHYLARGFSAVRVTTSVEIAGTSSGPSGPVELVRPTIVINEGPSLTIAALEFDGRQALPEAELRAAAALAPGQPFAERTALAARDAIEQRYRSLGYRDVLVTPHAEPVAGDDGVVLRFTLTEGPQIRAGKVLVTGNRRIDTSTIERELVIAEGEPLAPERLVESQRRVAALGLFRRVDVTEVEQPGRNTRDVVVAVEEAPPTTIGYGGGIEAGSRLVAESADAPATERVEFAWRTFFEIGRRNLFGKNRSVNLFTRASLRRKNASFDQEDPSGRSLGFNEYRIIGTFREPRVFDWRANAQLSGFFEQAIRPSFSFARRVARAEVATAIASGVNLIGGYAYDHTRLFDEQISESDRPLIDRLFPQVTLSVFSVSALRDTRDDPLDPRTGTLVGLDQSLAARAVGSEVGFIKSFVQGALYRRLGPRAVLAARAQLGLARGFARPVPRLTVEGTPVLDPAGLAIIETVRDLPASERFFAGGATTVRGFALDRLGNDATLRDDGFPIGGNALIVLNAELRFPVWRSLGAAAFLDAGNVFPFVSDVDFSDVRASPGLGLRYLSPLGPIRVDLGFKLDRRTFRNGQREQLTALHISIGQAF
jgi:outer membrane protein assembly complex protein YaeT